MGLFDFFSSTPTQDKFASIVLKAIAAQGHSDVLHYDAEQFRLVWAEDSGRVFNLHNAYRDYCAARRSERPALLEKYFSGMFQAEMPATFAEVRSKLLPILRSRGLVEYLRLTPNDAADPAPRLPAAAPFSADTLLMLAVDFEHAMMTVTQSQLTEWGTTFDDALAIARDNLRDITVSNFAEFIPGLFVSEWNDSYDTSRILFPDVVFQANVGADPVMMVPTRNRFLVSALRDKASLMAMVELARTLAVDEGRPVSALMYRFDNGRALAFQPEDADVRAKLDDLRRIYLADDYASQKDMLDRANEKAGIDIFVASYQLYQSTQTGSMSSLGVWTENVDTLLPETDLVALVATSGLEEGREDGEHKLIRWADLEAAAGPFERIDDGYPVRYRPVNFPSREVRAALAEATL